MADDLNASTRTGPLVGLCLLIATADLIQPLLLPWRAKFVGALLGGLFYLACAVAIRRGHRVASLGVIGLPLLPASLLVAWSAGAPVPVDAPMIGVFVLQVLAAVAAWRWRSMP